MIRLREDARLTLAEIASRFGVSRQYVSKLLGKVGLLGIGAQHERMVIEARRKFPGFTVAEMAEHLSLSRAQVYRALANAGLPARPAIETWFWKKVAVGSADTCWTWQGCRMPNGYGSLKARDGGHTHRYAHRVAYELVNGLIPNGLMVLHHCDNPPCCNPAHLYLGTAKDNAQDRERRGRGRRPQKQKIDK